MPKKFFTVEEAREALPVIRELVNGMVYCSRKLEEYRDLVTVLAEKSSLDSGDPEATAYVESLLGLQSCLNRIQSLGCLVKGVQEGLVDFPHMRNGREVLLCWKHGEDDIGFWHEVDSGFAGRTPLLDSEQ